MDRRYVNQIQDKIDSAFVNAGYNRPRRGCVYLEVAPNIFTWYGLPCDSRSNEAIYYMLNIGLHFKEIEQMADLTTDKKYKLAECATMYDTFSSISGGSYKKFTFDPTEPENDNAEIARIISAVSNYGIEWCENNASLSVAEVYLRDKVESLGFNPERYACCLKLQNKNSLLNDFISEHKERLSQYGGQFVSSWNDFSHNLKVT